MRGSYLVLDGLSSTANGNGLTYVRMVSTYKAPIATRDMLNCGLLLSTILWMEIYSDVPSGRRGLVMPHDDDLYN